LADDKGRFQHAGRKVDDAFGNIEQDVKEVIQYLNDEVVPSLRKNSSRALRTASEKLTKLAEFMEKQGK